MKALWIVVCAGAGLYGQAVQRTIKENPIARGSEAKAPANTSAPAPGQALESIFASSEDLNAIRDGYLRRLSGDGCPTDVAIHVAELRARLRDLESDAPAAETVAKPKLASLQTSAEMELALQALAATWKDRALADTMPPAASRESDQAKMLSQVLPVAAAQGPAAQPANAAQLRSEIARLMEGCKAVKP
jgi:hypothetical protein